MSTTSHVPELIQKHVPAWKKLGLKLKFAKEEPEASQSYENGTVKRKRRKVPAEEGEAAVENLSVERPTKRIKKSKLRAEETGEAVNGDLKPSDEPVKVERSSRKAKKSKVKTDMSTVSINNRLSGANGQETSLPPASKTTPTSKGKTVSFTPDTKTSDGDSVKGLYKTWIAKQKATDPSFDPSTVSPALRSIIPSTVASLESNSPIVHTSTSNSGSTIIDNKKPTKKKKTRLPKTSSGSGPSRFDPVLTYLTTHRTSPQTWKFSKPHQNQILKHLFSLKHIPPSYDPALLPYIRGLKGSSARSRIRNEALAVREEDEKWLASEPPQSERMENETAAQCNARRRRDYEAAAARIKRTLEEQEDEREERESELLGEHEEWEERLQKRRRAEVVLWGVREDEDELAESHVAAGSTGHQMESGITQLARAAREVQSAPRVGRGVGMGMGGVEAIDAAGIARGSKGKKVVFTDEGPVQACRTNPMNGAKEVAPANGVHAIKPSGADNRAANGTTPKRKRKHKRRTGVPDDDDSTSSSSSSSSSEEEEQSQRPQRVGMRARVEISDSESSSSGTASSSDRSDSD